MPFYGPFVDFNKSAGEKTENSPGAGKILWLQPEVGCVIYRPFLGPA
jgi:hypothetical protein